MKQLLVGSPFVGQSQQQQDIVIGNRSYEPLVTDPIPVIVPTTRNISSSSSRNIRTEQFILLPNQHYITVLSYKTGKRIATLCPYQQQQQQQSEDDTTTKNGSSSSSNTTNSNKEVVKTVKILCSTIATYPPSNLDVTTVQSSSSKSNQSKRRKISITSSVDDNDDKSSDEEEDIATKSTPSSSSSSKYVPPPQQRHVLLIGCNDGTIQEFDLQQLVGGGGEASLLDVTNSKYYWDIPGPVYYPNRIFRIGKIRTSIHRLTAIQTNTTTTPYYQHSLTTKNDLIIYAYTTTTGSKSNGNLLRIILPSTTKSSSIIYLKQNPYQNNIFSITNNNNNNNNNQEKDTTSSDVAIIPFQLLVTTATTVSNSGASNTIITVVVATANRLSIYSDPILSSSQSSTSPKDTNNTVLPVVHYDMKTIKYPKYSHITNTRKDVPDLLTAVTLAPNGVDIACGHQSGAIRILVQAIPRIAQYSFDLQMYNQQQQHKDSKVPIVTQKPNHPFDTSTTNSIIIRKLHWHAHPVVALRYDPAVAATNNTDGGILYSGGNESVLVMWQLSNGSYRPADYLPRIALGRIEHIVLGSTNNNNTNSIVVYCADNTIQLFDSVNKRTKWKIQGLATSSLKKKGLHNAPRPVIQVANTARGATASSLVAVSGLQNAPGCIHWYDPTEQNVVASLEVVPFNRVSQTDSTTKKNGDDITIPYPYVSHVAYSATNSDSTSMITIDVVPTENEAVGKKEQLPNGQWYGNTTTIRFWDRIVDSGVSSGLLPKYHPVASMTYPHGRSNSVSAIAISPNGIYAVTVSNDEKAFRLWQKYRSVVGVDNNTDVDDDDDAYITDDSSSSKSSSKRSSNSSTTKVPEWYCRCKVSTPSTLSNFTTGRTAVSFSHDSTVIAIGYGTTISLWDFQSVSLLTCHRHGTEVPTRESISKNNIIDELQFVNSTQLPDVLITKTKSSVVVQSAYGPEYGPKNFGWIWEVSPDEKDIVEISHAIYVASHNVVAIAVYDRVRHVSCLVLVNGLSGDMYQTTHSDLDPKGLFENIPGELVTLSAPSSKVTRSSSATADEPLRIYALTDSGEMILFSNEKEDPVTTTTPVRRTNWLTETANNSDFHDLAAVPLLASLTAQQKEQNDGKKRSLSVISVADLVNDDNNNNEVTTSTIRLSVSNFGSIIGGDTSEAAVRPTHNLPRLDGAFTQSFLARNIRKT